MGPARKPPANKSRQPTNRKSRNAKRASEIAQKRGEQLARINARTREILESSPDGKDLTPGEELFAAEYGPNFAKHFNVGPHQKQLAEFMRPYLRSAWRFDLVHELHRFQETLTDDEKTLNAMCHRTGLERDEWIAKRTMQHLLRWIPRQRHLPTLPETPCATDEWLHSFGVDGSFTYWKDKAGALHQFTPPQSRVVRFIITEAVAGRYVTSRQLNDEGHMRGKLRDLFRTNEKTHPAYHGLIVTLVGKQFTAQTLPNKPKHWPPPEAKKRLSAASS